VKTPAFRCGPWTPPLRLEVGRICAAKGRRTSQPGPSRLYGSCRSSFRFETTKAGATAASSRGRRRKYCGTPRAGSGPPRHPARPAPQRRPDKESSSAPGRLPSTDSPDVMTCLRQVPGEGSGAHIDDSAGHRRERADAQPFRSTISAKRPGRPAAPPRSASKKPDRGMQSHVGRIEHRAARRHRGKPAHLRGVHRKAPPEAGDAGRWKRDPAGPRRPESCRPPTGRPDMRANGMAIRRDADQRGALRHPPSLPHEVVGP